jgi:hypothetical protein
LKKCCFFLSLIAWWLRFIGISDSIIDVSVVNVVSFTEEITDSSKSTKLEIFFFLALNFFESSSPLPMPEVLRVSSSFGLKVNESKSDASLASFLALAHLNHKHRRQRVKMRTIIKTKIAVRTFLPRFFSGTYPDGTVGFESGAPDF